MKNAKKTNRMARNAYYSVDLPDIVDIDVLSYASDDELARRADYLHNDLTHAAAVGADTRPWEEEICYVQREMKIRSARRAAHERYVRFNPESHNTWTAEEPDAELN